VSMLQRIWDFTKRHQRGLLVVAGTIGGVYATTRYVRNKLNDYQRKSAEEFAVRENLKRRFEQNQSDCLFTVMALLPTLTEQLTEEVNVDALTLRLRQTRPAAPASTTVTEASNPVDMGSSYVQVEAPAAAEGEKHPEGTATPAPTPMEAGVPSFSAEQASETPAPSSAEKPPVVDRETKLQIWQEIKLSSFTRTVAAVYLLTLLTTLTHVQLNLVGRYIYVASVAESGTEAGPNQEASVKMGMQRDARLPVETERQYLSFSWWLLNVGWRQCLERTRYAVNAVVGKLSLKKACSYDDMCSIFDTIRTVIEEAPGASDGEPLSEIVRTMLIPDTDDEVLRVLNESGVTENATTITPELRNLLDETRDFLDSPDFVAVLRACLNESFSLLLHRLRDPMFPEPFADLAASSESGIREITEIEAETVDKRFPLVKLLPEISRKAHLVLNGYPNEYLNMVASTNALRAYSAIIYSSYDKDASTA
ncbi:Peroxin-3, partial [Thamnocephalis sphaerospora]